MNNLSEIAKIVKHAKQALLVSHIMPDGDTIGSALGLAWALRKRGVGAHLSCDSPVPPALRFLPKSTDYGSLGRTDEDVVFVIDCSDVGRMGSIYDAKAFGQVPVINIDHHVTNTRFGDINLVIPKASTAEIVVDLLEYLDIPLDETIATCLLAGVVTDTQGFRTSNTTADVLRTACTLIDAGASLVQVTDAAFNHRSLAMLRLWGPVLANAQLSDGVLWSEVTQDLVREAGGDSSTSSGLVNFLSAFDEARVAVLFRELETKQVDVSFRSSPGIDVSGIALAFGGGGHAQASGCVIKGDLADVRKRVLNALHELVTIGS
jgi:phosphoesterase RecJ-like protein